MSKPCDPRRKRTDDAEALTRQGLGSSPPPPWPPARSLIGKADGHPRSHRKKQGKMSELVGTRRNLCLFIVERISNNTDPLAPNPGLTLAGGPARLDASNDTAGR